ncbi:MAG TPA: response regulator [Gemmatimonadales bacterium]|nr:response regulator [Gemmatimonadales bacterium]
MDRTPPDGPPLVLVASAPDDRTGPFTRILETRGYAILRAESGAQTLIRAHHALPDLIALDATLPDMGTLETCRELRLDPRIGAATPIIITSADVLTREQRLAALRAGAWDTVGLGADPEESLLRVEAFARAKRELEQVWLDGLLDSETGLYNRRGLARRAREISAQAYRQHGAIACLVLAVQPDPQASAEDAESAVADWVRTLRAQGRVSDVIGRLGPSEFAVIAPATDARGAVKMAERLTTGPAQGGGAAKLLSLRAGYEAVANLGYAPLEPLELVVRAATAVRTGRPEEGAGWIRRYEGAPVS